MPVQPDITVDEPASPAALEMAPEAVHDFRAECFWWGNTTFIPATREDVREIIRVLRTSGGRRAWQTAQSITKCLKRSSRNRRAECRSLRAAGFTVTPLGVDWGHPGTFRKAEISSGGEKLEIDWASDSALRFQLRSAKDGCLRFAYFPGCGRFRWRSLKTSRSRPKSGSIELECLRKNGIVLEKTSSQLGAPTGPVIMPIKVMRCRKPSARYG